MRSVYDATMLADDLALRGHHDPFRVDPQAHRSIGEGCRDAVAIAFQMHETGR